MLLVFRTLSVFSPIGVADSDRDDDEVVCSCCCIMCSDAGFGVDTGGGEYLPTVAEEMRCGMLLATVVSLCWLRAIFIGSLPMAPECVATLTGFRLVASRGGGLSWSNRPRSTV